MCVKTICLFVPKYVIKVCIYGLVCWRLVRFMCGCLSSWWPKPQGSMNIGAWRRCIYWFYWFSGESRRRDIVVAMSSDYIYIRVMYTLVDCFLNLLCCALSAPYTPLSSRTFAWKEEGSVETKVELRLILVVNHRLMSMSLLDTLGENVLFVHDHWKLYNVCTVCIKFGFTKPSVKNCLFNISSKKSTKYEYFMLVAPLLLKSFDPLCILPPTYRSRFCVHIMRCM